MSSSFDNTYVYQVARLRAHELSLFNKQNFTNFLQAKNEKDLMNLLREKGWGGDSDNNIIDMLASERKKLWTFIDEMISDKSVFDIFRLKNDYNNIKAAVKEAVSNDSFADIYIEETTLDMERIKNAIRDKNYNLLDDDLMNVVKDAHETLLKYADSQMADLVVDKACLDAIMKAKEKTCDDFLKMYAELTVATSDIKIAYRAIKTKKDKNFLEMAIAECDSLSKNLLIESALRGMDAFYSYLQNTDYRDAAEILKESANKFEKWCTNVVVKRMQEELYNSFGIGPIAAYILARENEMRNIKIIASGIENGLTKEDIEERLCETYV